MGSSTRTNSGSPSTRTRSLSSPANASKSSRVGSRGRTPALGAQRTVHSAAAAAAATTTTTSPAKKPREDKKSKSKSRRPKFQDNPSAPEIVEKQELKPEVAHPDAEAEPEVGEEDGEVCDNVANSANGHQEDESEEDGDDEDVNAQLSAVKVHLLQQPEVHKGFLFYQSVALLAVH